MVKATVHGVCGNPFLANRADLTQWFASEGIINDPSTGAPMETFL
jgi:hypothetical protein